MVRICILFILILSACSAAVKEKKELEGYWQLTEIRSSGIQQETPEGAYIVYHGDGTYEALLDPTSGEIAGKWNTENDVMKMWQPEIKDLHGGRSIEPFRSTWKMTLSGEWLILEGLPTYDLQHLKLTLRHKPD